MAEWLGEYETCVTSSIVNDVTRYPLIVGSRFTNNDSRDSLRSRISRQSSLFRSSQEPAMRPNVCKMQVGRIRGTNSTNSFRDKWLVILSEIIHS
jgi:hypothetical protein